MSTDHRDLEAFARLPMTVSLAEFSAWTGINKWALMEMRRSGNLRVVTVGTSRRARYLKSEIARLCNLPLHGEGARSVRR